MCIDIGLLMEKFRQFLTALSARHTSVFFSFSDDINVFFTLLGVCIETVVLDCK